MVGHRDQAGRNRSAVDRRHGIWKPSRCVRERRHRAPTVHPNDSDWLRYEGATIVDFGSRKGMEATTGSPYTRG